MREESQRVKDDVIQRMFKNFQEPLPTRFAWEAKTIVYSQLDSERCQKRLDYIIDELMRNWQEAVPPLPDPEIEEERRAAAQQETKESGVHQLDLYLRSCISNFMQEKQNQISKLGSQNIVKEVAIEKKRILGVYKSDSQQIDVLKIQLSDFLESLLLE